MISPRFALLTILATSAVASAGAHGNHVRRDDELTTTTTEVVYVTVTQTITSSGDSHTVYITPTITHISTTTTTTEEATDTPCSTDVTTVKETTTVKAPSNVTITYPTVHSTVVHPTVVHPTVSGGYPTTVKGNETTYYTSVPSTTEGAAVKVKAGSVVALMAFVGAVVAML